MASTNLDILIKARDQASAAIKKVQTAGTGLGTTMTKSTATASKSMTSFASTARKVAGYIGIAFGVRMFVDFAVGAVKAFEEAQVSLRRFALAAQDSGIDVDRFNQTLDKMQWNLAIDDEALREIAIQLMNMGGAANLSNTELAAETLAIENIGAATGKSATLIQRMFVALNTGNATTAVTGLKRLGLLTGDQVAHYKELIAAGHSAAVSTALMSKATQAFPHAAEAAITTSQELSHWWGETTEQAGSFLTAILHLNAGMEGREVLAWSKSMSTFVGSVAEGTPSLQAFVEAQRDLTGEQGMWIAQHPEVFQAALNDAYQAGEIDVTQYRDAMVANGKSQAQAAVEIARVNGLIAQQGGNLRKSAKDMTHFTFIGVKDWRVWRDATIEATNTAMNSLDGIDVQTKTTAKDFQHGFDKMIRASKQYDKALSRLASVKAVPVDLKQWLIDQGPAAVEGFVAQSKKAQDQDITKWKQHQGVIEDTDRIIKSLGSTAKSTIGTATNMAAGLRTQLAGIAGTYDVNVALHVTGGVPYPGGRDGSLATPYPLARGGIVTRPTLALIGEAGPEAVIPLRRGGRAPAATGRGGPPAVLLDRKRFVEVADHEVRYSGHA